MSVVINTSSSGWPKNFSFMFFKANSISCSSRIRAFAQIPFMEHDVVFPAIIVRFSNLVLSDGGSSFATHFFVFCRECSFCSSVSSPDSFSLSAWVKKNCSSSVTSDEAVVTWMGVVWISYRILRRIFPLTLSCSLERKSAAVLTEPAICAISKLNCNT